MVSRFCGFYGAYKIDEVKNMPHYDFMFNYNCMEKVIAKNDMDKINIISYPHMKSSSDRNRFFEKLVKKSETEKQLESRVVSSDELTMNGLKLGNIKDFI